VRKIRALGIDVDAPIIGYSPRITARDAAFAPLQGAIEQRRRRVRLSEAGERRLAGAACSRSRWSSTRRAGTCTGSTRRQGDRTFLLSRHRGDVAITDDVRPPSCARAPASVR
jgi:proteasome accessory factor B